MPDAINTLSTSLSSASASLATYDLKDVTKAAYDGAYVHGLILEGACLNHNKKFWHPWKLYSRMPMIYCLLSENYDTASHDYPMTRPQFEQ
jgi:hypothetical protein